MYSGFIPLLIYAQFHGSHPIPIEGDMLFETGDFMQYEDDDFMTYED